MTIKEKNEFIARYMGYEQKTEMESYILSKTV